MQTGSNVVIITTPLLQKACLGACTSYLPVNIMHQSIITAYNPLLVLTKKAAMHPVLFR